MMRSALLDTTTLCQPLPTPPGLRDARQMEHLRLAEEMEATAAGLPRFGATLMSVKLRQGAWAHRMMAEMTIEEERAWLDEVAETM